MPPLAEVQAQVRQAVVEGRTVGPPVSLYGGPDPLARLAIHRRHYEASLVTALLTKFPATVWLAGSPFVSAAAREFVKMHPPRQPCIAEYGAAFPTFLGHQASGAGVPYLGSFAALEWRIGQASIAVESPALSWDAAARLGPDLVGAAVTLQGGVSYLRASWPIDELLRLFLTDSAPDRLAFAAEEVWLEVRGARGEFRIHRLDAAEFAFRLALARGRAIIDAADDGLTAAAAVAGRERFVFEPNAGLAALFADGLAVGITAAHVGSADPERGDLT